MRASHVIATAMLTSTFLLSNPVGAQARPDSEDRLLVEELTGSNKHLQDLAPGDTTEWAAQVTNTANTPTAIRIDVRAVGDQPLVSDPVEGVQLVVDLCAGPLSARMTDSGATIFTCRTGETRLGLAPAAALASDPERLTTRSELQPGGTTSVRLRIQLPSTAGNALENNQGELRVSIVAADPSGTVPDSDANPDGSNAPADPDTGARPVDGATPEDPAVPHPGAQGPFEPGPGLALTGRDVSAALVGAFFSTIAGLTMIAVSRRRRARAIEAA